MCSAAIAMLNERTLRAIDHFPTRIDQLKSVRRQSPLLDQSRKENSAEHS